VSIFERIKCGVAIISIGAVIFTTPTLAASSMAGSGMVLECGPSISGPTGGGPPGPAWVSPIRTGAGPRLRDLTPVLPVGHTAGHERIPHPALQPNAAGGWKDASLTVKVWSIVGTVVVVGIIAASMDD
jgi:hypothetical protein